MATLSLPAPAQVRRTTAPRPTSPRPIAALVDAASAARDTTAPRTASGARPLRLTRRGRRLVRTVVVLLALLVTLVLLSVGHGAASQAGDGPAVPATRTVVVQPGQTLWTIARAITPDADLRDTVARIQELSGLSGSAANAVRPGQALVVPVEG